MDFIKRNLNILLGAIVILIILLGILFATGNLNLSKFGVSIEGGKIVIEPDANLMTIKSANNIALARAKEWQPDAKVSDVKSLAGQTGPNGRSDNWEFLFVSDTAKKKGFRISITNGVITKTEELPFVSKGGDLPENIISAKDAIAKVHQIKGYENEKVISVELLYDPKGYWYWGVQTSKGFVSVRANK